MQLEVIEQTILDAVREVAAREDVALPDHIDAGLTLFGPQGCFDSLALVGLIVEVEESISDDAGRSIVLADERALSQSRSPFRTVSSLAAYVAEVLGESER